MRQYFALIKSSISLWAKYATLSNKIKYIHVMQIISCIKCFPLNVFTRSAPELIMPHSQNNKKNIVFLSVSFHFFNCSFNANDCTEQSKFRILYNMNRVGTEKKTGSAIK